MLVERLGMYSKELRNLEGANPLVAAQQVSENLCISQEWEQKEIEEQIAKEAIVLMSLKPAI